MFFSSQARLQDGKLTIGEQVAWGMNMMSSALLDPPQHPRVSMGLAAMTEDLKQVCVFPESHLEEVPYLSKAVPDAVSRQDLSLSVYLSAGVNWSNCTAFTEDLDPCQFCSL